MRGYSWKVGEGVEYIKKSILENAEYVCETKRITEGKRKRKKLMFE